MRHDVIPEFVQIAGFERLQDPGMTPKTDDGPFRRDEFFPVPFQEQHGKNVGKQAQDPVLTALEQQFMVTYMQSTS